MTTVARPVWAVFVKEAPAAVWQLGAVSVLSADRARGLIEREHARQCVQGASYLVMQYDTMDAVPFELHGAVV